MCIQHNLDGRTNKTKVNLINYENIGKKLQTIGKRFYHTALYAILSLSRFNTEFISKGKKEKDGTRPCKLQMYVDEILCVWLWNIASAYFEICLLMTRIAIARLYLKLLMVNKTLFEKSRLQNNSLKAFPTYMYIMNKSTSLLSDVSYSKFRMISTT